MSCTVVTLPSADDELARIWAGATDRGAVSDASNKIDDALRNRAGSIGVPRGDTYVFTVPPSAVVFKHSPDDCLVTIVGYREVS